MLHFQTKVIRTIDWRRFICICVSGISSVVSLGFVGVVLAFWVNKHPLNKISLVYFVKSVYKICQHWLLNRWPSLSTGRWALTQNEGEAMNIITTPIQDIIVSLRSAILNQNWQKHSLFVLRQANQPTAGRQQLVRPDPGIHGLVGQHDRRVGQRHRPQAHHLPDGERCQFALPV